MQLRRSARKLVERVQRRSTAARPTHPSALQCIVASNDFGSYCVPKASFHRPAAQAVLQGRVWERETIDLMRANCGTGDIIHAGTYFGDFLPALSGVLSEGAKVWAFEPNIESFRCASITMQLNGLVGRVKLTHAALGPESGTVMISVTDDTGRALGGASRINGSGKQSVAQVALDEAIPEDRCISILQLDVEGYEEMALRGAEKMIRRDKPVLILETNPTGEWFKALSRDCGYALERKLPENSVFTVGGTRLK